MQNQHLPDWESQLRILAGRSVSCPTCETLITVASMEVLGQVLDVDHSSHSVKNYLKAVYPCFIPEIYPYPVGYAVALCPSCKEFLVVEAPKETYKSCRPVWPLPGTRVSEDIPEPVRAALADAKLAAAAGSKTGAVMSIRTAVERVQRREKVKSLSELWDIRKLPTTLFDTANEPRLWGHVTAHDDFDPSGVTDDHIKDLLDFIDVFMDMLYITPKRLDRARKARQKIGDTEEVDSSKFGP